MDGHKEFILDNLDSMLPMAKPIQDDFDGTLLDSESDTIYGLTVTKRGTDAEGNRQLLKLEFDIGHTSFVELIANRFEGKKALKKWQKWIPATRAQKEADPDAKGKWIRMQ